MEKVNNEKFNTVEVRLNAMDDALILRTSELDRRLEGLNQLREDVVRDRDMFLRKDVYDIKMVIHDSFVADMTARVTRLETRSVVWGSVIALMVILLQLLSHLLWK